MKKRLLLLSIALITFIGLAVPVASASSKIPNSYHGTWKADNGTVKISSKYLKSKNVTGMMNGKYKLKNVKKSHGKLFITTNKSDGIYLKKNQKTLKIGFGQPIYWVSCIK